MHTSTGLAVIPAGEQYLELDDLYVLPEHRNRSIGTQLVEALLHTAATEGVSRGLVLSATRDWQRIVAFYQRFGFEMWYVQMFR